MDTTQQLAPITQSAPIAPAQLWTGPAAVLTDHVVTYLQALHCTHKGCGHCLTCNQIRHQQFHGAVWLMPEKQQYTLEQLAIIGTTIAFALQEDEHYFFIIQKADLLTPTCANSLLKSIEEPPTGYHFILLTDRPNVLLPTIRSRCVIKSWQQPDFEQEHHLAKFFTSNDPVDPEQFLKVIEQSKINEQESLALVDSLLRHWTHQYKTAVIANNISAITAAHNTIKLLANAHTAPFMPGSSKIFWKNLLLQIKH